jgi:hypothetical protein
MNHASKARTIENDVAQHEQERVTRTPGLPPAPGKSSSAAMEEARFQQASFQSGQSPTEILEQLTGSLAGEEPIPATKASDLNLGQPIYGPKIGHGTVAAINGDQATIKLEDSNGDITESIIAVALLITLTQAQVAFDYWWVRGKQFRLQVGKWLWIAHELCKLTGHGVWKAWLDEHDDYPRSTAYDYIREYKNEVVWALQDQQAAQKKTEATGETSEIRTFEQTQIIEDRKIHERTPDPDNDRRTENTKSETVKREGIKPTYHKTILYLKRRNIDPNKLQLFHDVRTADKRRVDEIMQRAIDSGIDEVLALAPILLPSRTEIAKPATEEREPDLATVNNQGPHVEASTAPASDATSPEVTVDAAAIEAKVRARLRKEGVTKKELDGMQFIKGLPYKDQYLAALKQL